MSAIHDQLEDAFYRYMESVVKGLEAEKAKFSAIIAAYPGFEATILDRILSKVESSDEIKSLVKLTEAVTPPEYFRYMEEPAVKNFFRRSGIYNQLRQGHVPEVSPALERYVSAFSQTVMRTTHIAPLDFLHMKGNSMKFQTFELRKFSASELNTYFGQDVNRGYYKNAVMDLKNLHHYWWLLRHDETPLQHKPLDKGEPEERVKLHHSKHEELEMPMKILALYNWQIKPLFINYFGGGVPGLTWTPLFAPFVVSLHDNLLEEPLAIDVDLKHMLWSLLDEPDGDMSAEGPLDYWDFDETESAGFEDFLRRTESMVLELGKIEEWQFVVVALDYFLKAFESEGKEQMLWHIIVLESLLGQKGDPLTESLGTRLATITCADEKEQKRVKKKFRELYNFRCDVVHGNAAGKDVMVDHLNEARYFARDTVIWFLNTLTELQKSWREQNPERPLPSRKDLLCYLDMSPTARTGLDKIKSLMPATFPHVPEWLK